MVLKSQFQTKITTALPTVSALLYSPLVKKINWTQNEKKASIHSIKLRPTRINKRMLMRIMSSLPLKVLRINESRESKIKCFWGYKNYIALISKRSETFSSWVKVQMSQITFRLEKACLKSSLTHRKKVIKCKTFSRSSRAGLRRWRSSPWWVMVSHKKKSREQRHLWLSKERRKRLTCKSKLNQVVHLWIKERNHQLC